MQNEHLHNRALYASLLVASFFNQAFTFIDGDQSPISTEVCGGIVVIGGIALASFLLFGRRQPTEQKLEPTQSQTKAQPSMVYDPLNLSASCDEAQSAAKNVSDQTTRLAAANGVHFSNDNRTVQQKIDDRWADDVGILNNKVDRMVDAQHSTIELVEDPSNPGHFIWTQQ